MTVTENKYVTINYKFSTPDGYLLGSSDHQGPLSFMAGAGDVISGLDKRLIGREVGENLTFVIPPDEAYGARDEALVTTMALDKLPAGTVPRVGMKVDAEVGGRWRVCLISEIKDDHLVLDANHPLAGVPLHFECSVLSLEDEAPQMGCGCGSGGCGSGGCSTEGSEAGCGCGSGESGSGDSSCGSGCGCH